MSDDLGWSPEIRTRWSEVSGGIDGAYAYRRRFDALAEQGADLHGEARFVTDLRPPPSRVLDAGCGEGRIATRLTQLGHDVVAVDADPHLVALAEDRDTETRFVHADLADLWLRSQAFDVILMAGNVVPYLADGTLVDVLRRLRMHLDAGGLLVTGYTLPGPSLPHGGAEVPMVAFERAAFAAGLSLVQHYASWERAAWPGDGSYRLSLHRPA